MSPNACRLAPPAADWQAHRHCRRRLAGHGQPCAEARRTVAAQGPGAGRAGAPLRARDAWRDDPHRHQEARFRTSERGRLTGWCPGRASGGKPLGPGISSTSRSTTMRHRFREILAHREKGSAPVPFMEDVVAAYYAPRQTPLRVKGILIAALGLSCCRPTPCPTCMLAARFTDDVAVLRRRSQRSARTEACARRLRNKPWPGTTC